MKEERSFEIPPELIEGRALVVDDNITAQRIIQRFLESFSLKVDTASNGKESLRKIEETDGENSYKLVFLDWEMPDMNGSQVAAEILSNENITVKPKIIMITAYGREEIMKEAEEAGVEGFLIKPVSKLVLFDTIRELYLDENHFVQEKVPDRQKENKDKSLSGIRVLLVEDNEINQQVAGELLTHEGMKVVFAENGVEAVDFLKEYSSEIDLVLMDLQMPLMDGYEATVYIRNELKLTDLPILAMTADAMDGIIEKTEHAGMNDCIVKPLDVEALYEKLKRWSNKISNESQGGRTEKEGGGIIMEEKLARLEGIEWKEGLERVAGNSELYGKLLLKFKENNSDIIKDAENLLIACNYEEAERKMHTLKGISGNIGAVNLHQIVVVLDDELKKESCDFELAQRLMKNAEGELQKVMTSIENVFGGEKKWTIKIPISIRHRKLKYPDFSVS